MNQILKLDVQGLNLLFNQFSELENKFLWVTTLDHSRQIYIGSGYEKIWKKSCEELYKDISSWHTSLIETEREKIVQALTSRKPDDSEKNRAVFCCFHDAEGNVRFTKDTCFYLSDQSGQEVATAGVVELITQTQYEQKSTKLDPPKNSNHTPDHDFLTIINKEFKLLPDTKNTMASKTNSNENAKLTPREKECLLQLSSGQSAKKIARVLDISPRTVEIHIDNIKRKLECRTRLEVISKLNGAAMFY